MVAYDLLISCPGDVSEYVDVVYKCVDEFNRLTGYQNKILIIPRYWSKDAYSQLGMAPQEILNQQLVRDCDIAVAIFWTRLGTQTDRYASGTEEEIAEMRSSGKQVFLYFIDAPITPSLIDQGQYEKLKRFKDEYRKKGLSFSVKCPKEFKETFSAQLTSYFLHLKEKHIETLENTPILKIQDAETGVTNSATAYPLNISPYLQFEVSPDQILSKIVKLNDTIISGRESKDVSGYDDSGEISTALSIDKVLGRSKKISGMLADWTKGEKVSIPGLWKRTIIDFSKERGVKIHDSFWNVGSLTRGFPLVSNPYTGVSTSLIGGVGEKERYAEIEKIFQLIEMFNTEKQYFLDLKNLVFVKLAVINAGTTYDEDIEISLKIPGGCLADIEELPVPQGRLLEKIVREDTLADLFQIQETASISAYDGADVVSGLEPVPMPLVTYKGLFPEQMIDSLTVRYFNSTKRIFNYKKFSYPDVDILKFNISRLMHNTGMAFPSLLVFKKSPDSISYEIRSKFLARIQQGTMLLETMHA